MYGKDGEVLGFVDSNLYKLPKPSKNEALIEAFEDLQSDGTIKPIGVALKEDIWDLKARQLDISKALNIPSKLFINDQEVEGAKPIIGVDIAHRHYEPFAPNFDALNDLASLFKEASSNVINFAKLITIKRKGYYFFRKLSRKQRKEYRKEQKWQALYVPLTLQLSTEYDSMKDFLLESFIWGISYQGSEYWEKAAGYERDENGDLLKL